MNQLLEKIVQNKLQEVERFKETVPVSALLTQVKNRPIGRCFTDALRHLDNVAVIAEIKKASPSAGIIREDFDPVGIAKAYQANGAAAISVLTDHKFFSGNLDYLREVRAATTLPLLRKDFMIDRYQVVEARVNGANCILIIMAILSDKQARELASAAAEFQLDVLAEVHAESELDRALDLGFRLIGINNRDLKTFSVDLSTTEKLISLLPQEIVVVSESGIKCRADAERLGQMGVDAILVGETLMREEDVGRALKSICGVAKWSR